MKFSSLIATLMMLAAALALAGCQSGPTAGPVVAEVPTTSPISPTEYQLGSGDQLRVTVFGEPDLSGEFQVDGTGQVSLPLIGNISVTGMTVQQFQATVEERLRAGYLNQPRVSAEVINYRPFYILGEVNRPGEYPYTSGLTVMNAVATAEGFTYRANRRVVFIRSAGTNVERRVDLTSTTLVQPGDTIRIAERLF